LLDLLLERKEPAQDAASFGRHENVKYAVAGKGKLYNYCNQLYHTIQRLPRLPSNISRISSVKVDTGVLEATVDGTVSGIISVSILDGRS
jgi:hypothetical protein